ncbi:MAG: serine/threonine transporter SstT [Lachnospiraceae bacterium]|nr:serine/threonine transporter SstT [Lachnospiraceae bacterium]
MKEIVKKYNDINLMLKIIMGMAIGIIAGIFLPGISAISLLGKIFVGALKALAPILVFVMVTASLSTGNNKLDSRFSFVIFLYLASTLLAGLVAVFVSFLFPVSVTLSASADISSAPGEVGDIFTDIILSIVSNPVKAISDGTYMGILFWAVLIGLAMKKVASDTTKQLVKDASNTISRLVAIIISMAPFGILGLVYGTVSESGMKVFVEYGKLLLVLVVTILIVALVVNPFIVFLSLRTNPYPLVFRCLKGSAAMAFFMRSSAANIPVNMELCEKLGINRDIYNVSIPLGATINMDGAAVVITIMTMTAANTLGMSVDIKSAIVMSITATLAACGASGVAGGSLLLIPLACSFFNIPNDVTVQIVGVGYIINVIQDSFETALNSSGDVLFTATAEYRHWKKTGKSLPTFLGGKTRVEDI